MSMNAALKLIAEAFAGDAWFAGLLLPVEAQGGRTTPVALLLDTAIKHEQSSSRALTEVLSRTDGIKSNEAELVLNLHAVYHLSLACRGNVDLKLFLAAFQGVLCKRHAKLHALVRSMLAALCASGAFAELLPALTTACLEWIYAAAGVSAGGDSASAASVEHKAVSGEAQSEVDLEAVCVLARDLLTLPQSKARDSLEAALLKLTLQVIAGSGTLQARSTVTHKLLPCFCDPASALASATDASVRAQNLKLLYEVILGLWNRAVATRFDSESTTWYDVFGLLCHYYPQLQAANIREVSTLSLHVAKVGLDCALPILRKQAAYILRLRMQHTLAPVARGEAKASLSADFSIDQWEAFLVLYETLQSSSLHLLEAIWPKIQLLFQAEGMEEWVHIIIRQGFTNTLTSVRLWVTSAIVSSFNSSTSRVSLNHDFLLGPFLDFVNNPVWFRPVHGEAQAESFGVRFENFFFRIVSDLSDKPASTVAAAAAGAAAATGATGAESKRDLNPLFDSPRAVFIRRLMSALSGRVSSVAAMEHLIHVLRRASPFPALDSGGLRDLRFLLTMKINETSYRRKTRLQPVVAQLALGLADWSRCSSAAIARVLTLLPEALLGPQSTLFPMLLREFEPRQSLLMPAVRKYFEGEQSKASAGSGASAAAADEFDQAKLARKADQLALLFQFVPQESAAEKAVFEFLESQLQSINAQLYAAPGTQERTVSLLLRLIRDLNATPSAAAAAAATASAAKSDSAASADSKTAPAASGASAAAAVSAASSDYWKHRRGLLESLMRRTAGHVLALVDARLFPRSSSSSSGSGGFSSVSGSEAKSDSAAVVTAGVSRARWTQVLLVTALRQLLTHFAGNADVRAYRDKLWTTCIARIAAGGLSAGSSSSAGAASSVSSFSVFDRMATISGLHALVCSHEFKTERSASAGKDDEKAVESYILGGGRDDARLSAFLLRHLAVATLGKRPAAGSSAAVGGEEWGFLLQDFSRCCWQSVHHMLQFTVPAASARALLQQCTDALDGASEDYTADLFASVRLLSPWALVTENKNGSFSADARAVQAVLDSSWTAFSDIERISAHKIQSFLGMVFNPCLFRLRELHADGSGGQGGPLRLYVRKLLKLAHSSSMLAYYFTTHAVAVFAQFPSIATLYVKEIADLCMFHEESMEATGVAVDKLNFHVISHITHNRSGGDTPKPLAAATFTATFSESMIRAMTWSLLEHMAKRQRESGKLGDEGSVFFGELITHMLSLNSNDEFKGSNSVPEGSTLFVRRAYLWQTLCVLSRALPLASPQKAVLEKVRAVAWRVLDYNNSPGIRHLLEVFLASVCSLYPETLPQEVVPRLLNSHERPTLVASLVVVGGFGLMHCEPSQRATYHEQFVSALFPSLTSNFGQIRAVAQYFFYTVLAEGSPKIQEWKKQVAAIEAKAAAEAKERKAVAALSQSAGDSKSGFSGSGSGSGAKSGERGAGGADGGSSSGPGDGRGTSGQGGVGREKNLHQQRALEKKQVYKEMKREQRAKKEAIAKQRQAVKDELAGVSSVVRSALPKLPMPLSQNEAALNSMFLFLHTQGDCARMRQKMTQYFDHFNPIYRCTMEGILADSSDDVFFVAEPLLDRLKTQCAEFLSELRFCYDEIEGENTDAQDTYDPRLPELKGLDGKASGGGSGDKKRAAGGAAGAEADDEDEDDAAPSAAKQTALQRGDPLAASNFQKKIETVPVAEMFALAHSDTVAPGSVGEKRNREDVKTVPAKARQSIIVVASLVDKLPNLAGLARTCEIFNAEELVVQDLKITEDAIFKRVSVTADQWLPMREVKEDRLKEFLLQQKRNGYVVIALEQTAHSTSLPRYRFPAKVCLILGKEKEGVPVDLLNLVDACIEIPQYGIIRSLNVHVSASVLIWEYTRQFAVSGAGVDALALPAPKAAAVASASS